MQQTPDWNYWLQLGSWKIADAACLSLNMEPRHPIIKKQVIGYCQDGNQGHPIDNRIDIIKSSSASFEFTSLIMGDPLSCSIRPLSFINWAIQKDWTLPENLTIFADQENKSLSSTQTQIHKNGSKWPWGTHETKLLEKLAEAAEKFWLRYEPSDPSTAPTNEQVEDWLISQHVSKRVAEVMAQILRADGLPPGPRK